MSRADDLRAAADLEATVVELEEELARQKGLKRGDPAKYRETKNALREARQRHRDLRAGAPVADGDAAVSPGSVNGSVGVPGPGEGA